MFTNTPLQLSQGTWDNIQLCQLRYSLLTSGLLTTLLRRVFAEDESSSRNPCFMAISDPAHSFMFNTEEIEASCSRRALKSALLLFRSLETFELLGRR